MPLQSVSTGTKKTQNQNRFLSDLEQKQFNSVINILLFKYLWFLTAYFLQRQMGKSNQSHYAWLNDSFFQKLTFSECSDGILVHYITNAWTSLTAICFE